MWKVRNGLLILFLLLYCIVIAGGVDTAAEGIEEAQLRRWLSRLASAEFEGRGTATEGQEKAAKMIEKVFAEAKLRRFDTLNSYRQNLGMERFELVGEPLLATDNIVFKYEDDFSVSNLSGPGEVDAPLVFCGYGITSKSLSYDDYKGIDVEGKVVLLLRKAPRFNRKNSPFRGEEYRHAYFTEKVANAVRHGAVAVLLASGNEKDDKNIREYMSFPALFAREKKGSIPVLFVTPETAKRLIGKDLKELQRRIDGPMKPASFLVKGRKVRISVKVERKEAKTANICGYIEGSDEYLKERFIVVGAHYDHLGKRGNRIYFGADDNASGTAAVLALAKAFSTLNTPPRRSVIFVAFTAEEIGLIGSSHFVENCPVLLESIDAMVNLDMVGRVPPGPSAWFRGALASSIFEKAAKKAAKKASIKVRLSESPGGGSDHISFARKGIPSVFVIASRNPDYHTPNDTAEKIDYEGMCSVVRATFHFVRSLADYEGTLRNWIDGVPVLGFFVESREDGLEVVRILKESAAAKSRLKVGDIIIEAEGRPIKNEDDFEKALKDLKEKKRMSLLVGRGRSRLRINIQLPPLPKKPRRKWR